LCPAFVPVSPNTQYQLERSPKSNPIVSFDSEKILICFATAVLTFFIAGLLYLLCFQHVDNLGAYSIPSETGLLIPSVGVEKLEISEIRENLGDRKYLADQRKSFVGHPDAI
jgi:hypothetical protein